MIFLKGGNMRRLRQQAYPLDYSFLYILLALFLFSVLTVYSGSGQYVASDPFYFTKRQVIWYAIGLGLLFAIANMDYRLLQKFAWPIYISGIVLLMLVHFFGVSRNGSQRWLDLRLFEFQPSEFVKIGLILFLAHVLVRHDKSDNSQRNQLMLTLKLAAATAVPFYFILAQPDLGSALVVMSAFFAVLMISGVSLKLISALLALATAFIGVLVLLHQYFFNVFSLFIKPHQLDRIYGWLAPEQHASSLGYQLIGAKQGIGSGQMFGSGFAQGTQVQSGRIPEAHTDFIFSVIGEEFGFAGSAVLILLFLLLIYRIVLVAIRSDDLFGTYVAGGIAVLIAFQVFQNIGMTIGLMPVTGLALPFISYGGSALLTNMMALGLVLSIQQRSNSVLAADAVWHGARRA